MPENPDIDVEKDAAASPIPAGDAAVFNITVTNIGDVELSDYVFTDADCDPRHDRADGRRHGHHVRRRRGPYLHVLDRHRSRRTRAPCSNSNACASGMYNGVLVDDCDDCERRADAAGHAGHAGHAGDPGTPGTPGTPTTGGGTLPDTIASGQASLRGPSGCVKQAFRARVSGRSLASVTFFVDGKRVKRFSDSRALYTIKVNPLKFGFGRHRVTARVTFVSGSGTQARTLRLTFRRCARGTVAPRFTG